MDKRALVQEVLEEIQVLANEEPHVYFDPPETVKMTYPCFIYHFTGINDRAANDKPYLRSEMYAIRYITKKADAIIPKLLMDFPYTSFDRHYTADNLHHFMYRLNSPLAYNEHELNSSKIISNFLGGTND